MVWNAQPLPEWARAAPVAPPARAIKGVMQQTWSDEVEWADIVILEADVVIPAASIWPRKRFVIVQVLSSISSPHDRAMYTERIADSTRLMTNVVAH